MEGNFGNTAQSPGVYIFDKMWNGAAAYTYKNYRTILCFMVEMMLAGRGSDLIAINGRAMDPHDERTCYKDICEI